jgi:hypothetical protein
MTKPADAGAVAGVRPEPRLQNEPTVICPYCDGTVAVLFVAGGRGAMVSAPHLDYYPTRACEGGNRPVTIWRGRASLSTEPRP